VTLRCRPARPGDIAAVVELARLFCQEEGTGPSRLEAAHLERYAFSPTPLFLVLVAEEEERVVGYALYYAGFDAVGARKGHYLADLFVLREARGHGIGRRLMRAVAEDALARGGEWLTWNALERNRAARAFYRRIGAREHPLVTLSLNADALRRLARGEA
jgi:GNAT superfamily N-acetyltransferase